MQPQLDCGLDGQFILLAGDHVVDGPSGKNDVERKSLTDGVDDCFADILHEQTSLPYGIQSLPTGM